MQHRKVREIGAMLENFNTVARWVVKASATVAEAAALAGLLVE